jgi:hypothetical protein
MSLSVALEVAEHFPMLMNFPGCTRHSSLACFCNYLYQCTSAAKHLRWKIKGLYKEKAVVMQAIAMISRDLVPGMRQHVTK